MLNSVLSLALSLLYFYYHPKEQSLRQILVSLDHIKQDDWKHQGGTTKFTEKQNQDNCIYYHEWFILECRCAGSVSWTLPYASENASNHFLHLQH